MSTQFDSRHIFSQNPQVLSAAVGEQIALMSVARGRYYSLDPIATNIWARLAQPVSVSALAEAVMRDYAGDPQQIEADLQDLVRQLADEGLVDIDAKASA